jgi:tetratricopeptide (TPR) repeat protein
MLLVFICAASTSAGAEKCDLNSPRLSISASKALHKAQEIMEKGEDAKVRALLAPLVKEDPHHHVCFMLGLALHRMGKTKEAVKQYRQALKLKPCFTNARYNLAVGLAELKKPMEAAQEMMTAYRQAEKPDPEHLFQAAILYLQAEKPKVSLPLLEQLAARKNPKVSWLEALAHVYLNLKKPKQAEKVARNLLAREPGREPMWRISAQAAMMQENYGCAAARLRIALKLKNRGQSDWRSLGDLYRAAGAPAEAVPCYKKAMGDKPDARDYDRIAQAWLAAHRPKEALKAAQKAIKLKPTAKRRALVGEIYLSERCYKKAREAYAAAAAQHDPQGRYSLMLGYASWNVMDLTRAQKAFSQALKKAPPKSSTARQARSALKNLAQAQVQLEEERKASQNL